MYASLLQGALHSSQARSLMKVMMVIMKGHGHYRLRLLNPCSFHQWPLIGSPEGAAGMSRLLGLRPAIKGDGA